MLHRIDLLMEVYLELQVDLLRSEWLLVVRAAGVAGCFIECVWAVPISVVELCVSVVLNVGGCTPIARNTGVAPTPAMQVLRASFSPCLRFSYR